MSLRKKIDRIKEQVTDELLNALNDPDKRPRASMLNAAISWVKANDDTLGSRTPEEIAESLEIIRTKTHQGYVPFTSPDQRVPHPDPRTLVEDPDDPEDDDDSGEEF